MEEEKIGLTIDEILELVYQKLRLSCGAVDIECSDDEILRRQMAFRDEQGWGRAEFSNCERLFEIKKDDRLYWVGLSKTELKRNKSLVRGETSNIFVLKATAFHLPSYQEVKKNRKLMEEIFSQYNFDALMEASLFLVARYNGTLGVEPGIEFEEEGLFQDFMKKFSTQAPTLNPYYVIGSSVRYFDRDKLKWRNFLWNALFADYLVEVIKENNYFKCF